MAQYDALSYPRTDLLLLDMQSNVLNALHSRAVIPLMPISAEFPVMKELNPVLNINDKDYFLSTQDMAGVSTKVLKRKVATANEHLVTINAAIDFRMHGY